MIMIYMYYIYLMSLMMWGLGLYLYNINQSYMYEWIIMSLLSFSLVFMIYLDWISMIFMSIVMFISLMIMIYSVSYMKKDNNIKWFFNLMLLFILMMLMLVISPSMISLMFGWDGLGLISYLLVIYYQNYSSNYSGMITILMNRVGDIMILMIIGMMLMYGSWSMFYMSDVKMMSLFMLMAGLSKSAQLPFSSWLPLAMAAPTPVSALVHSSTLVTAGVYLIIRYSEMLNKGKMDMLVYISILTMFMAGLMALYENDLKKIIALSTLSQMGLMMVGLGLGNLITSFYHLLVHAIFKSLMFMSVGIILHVMDNNQDIRRMGNLFEFIPLTMISMLISLVSLCGMPFMAGFYSKDLLMEMVYMMKMNFFMFMILLLSMMLSFMYSIRLIMYMYMVDFKISLMSYKEEKVMIMSMILLMTMSIMMGSVMSWMLFLEMFFLKLSYKILLIGVMIMGFMVSIMCNMIDLINMYKVGYFMSSMMFYNIVLINMNEKVLKLMNYLNKNNFNLFEYYSENLVYNFIYSYLNYYMNNRYKIYLYMCMIMMIMSLVSMMY